MMTLKSFITLFAVLILEPLHLSAQDDNTFPQSGPVGINTTTPLADLHINGLVRGPGVGALQIQTEFGSLKIGPLNSGWSHFTTDRSKFYFNNRIVIGGGRSISSYREFPLLLSTNSGAAETMRLMPDGNVGIGIEVPLERLHINGSVRGDLTGGALQIQTQYGYLQIGPQSSSWAHFRTDRSKFYFNEKIVVGGDRSISAYGDYPLSLETNSGTNEIMRLMPNGYVGIGTTSPEVMLDVNGGIRISNSQQDLAGSIRWNGSDFEGYNGAEWVSLTINTFIPPQVIWTAPINGCHAACPSGYASGADENGNICRNLGGSPSNSVFYATINGSLGEPDFRRYVCTNGSNGGNFPPSSQVGQCRCVLVNPSQVNQLQDNSINNMLGDKVEAVLEPSSYEFSLSSSNNVQLNQNSPNPFTVNTKISFNIPWFENSATLIVYNNEGIILHSLDITQKGEGEANIEAVGLSVGTYSYSIVVDGEIIDSKLMIKH